MSRVRQGPVSPSVKDTLPDATERDAEVAKYGESAFELEAPAPAPSPVMEPPAPRKNPTGVFMSDARQLDAQSAAVVVSRTAII